MDIILPKRIGFVILVMAVMGCGTDGDGDTSEQDGGDTEERGPAELIPPIERDGAYVLEMTDGVDTVLFECKPEEGGLITKLMLNDQPMISQLTGDNQYGSTFWPSPQDWDWPPSGSFPELATNAYAATVEAATSTIVLTSAPDLNTGLQFIKRFSPDLVNMAFKLSYTMVNTSTEAVSVAPWEITRVLPGGLTFFPTGTEVFENTLSTEEVDGVTWFFQPTEGGSGDRKLYADGRDGWIAHAASGMVFVKTFADLPAEVRAPDESEIEIYAKASIYQEIEQQGAYAAIQPSERTTFDVKWFLRAMPSSAQAEIGDPGLVAFAAGFAGR